MNTLSTRLDEYLSLRRRLGFKMCQAGYLLPQFVRFAQQEKAAFITTKLALHLPHKKDTAHYSSMC